MICIACQKEFENLAKSHVIPNSFRKKLTGEEDTSGGKKFKFKFTNQPGLFQQDLPKPPLMCQECDNLLGATVEREAPLLLMPNKVDESSEWQSLPIKPVQLHGIFDTPLNFGIYNYPLDKMAIINKFCISIAWRALHAMKKNNNVLSDEFLKSTRGTEIDRLVYEYLFQDKKLSMALPVELYFIGPESAAMITGQDDEYPFAWAELGCGKELLGIAVIFANWVVLWPLFDSEVGVDKHQLLRKNCFLDWIAKVKEDLSCM